MTSNLTLLSPILPIYLDSDIPPKQFDYVCLQPDIEIWPFSGAEMQQTAYKPYTACLRQYIHAQSRES